MPQIPRNKAEVMGAFLQGASVGDLARFNCLSRASIETVIREGTLQALQQLAAQPDFAAVAAASMN